MVNVQTTDGREVGGSSPSLRLSSSSLGAFLEISPDALVLINQAGIIVMVNQQTEALFGYSRAQLLDQPLEQLLPERFRDGHREYLARYFSAPRTRPLGAGLPLFGLRQDGTEFPVDISLKPLLLDERLVALAAVRDMSAQRHMEEELAKRNGELERMRQEREVDRMKSEFVSLVSHELRTPLTSIKGYVDVLLTDQTDGELTGLQREFLGIIRNNARRLTNTTNDLLDLSHLESGKMELHLEALNINLLISELLPSFQPAWDEKRQTFTLHLPEEAPTVLGDADRVTQILTNLLSNAHKYTPEGGRIDLSVETNECSACITVADTGIGLSLEEQVHLFTHFYRADNTATKAVGGGTGLGFSITQSLVEMQGGEIQVDSTPGHGSTFRFTLPLVQQPTDVNEIAR